MKQNRLMILPLLAVLALCGCQTVKCKKPVGDAANLNPSEWNAKWTAVGGAVIVTRIKDAEKGIVEVTVIKGIEKPAEKKPDESSGLGPLLNQPSPPGTTGLLGSRDSPGAQSEKAREPQTLDLQVRTLGKYTLTCGNGGSPLDFFRVVNNKDFIIGFPPEGSAFSELVKQGKLSGTLDKDKDGNPAGCTLESFSQADYERLGKQGVDLRALFQEDPAAVFLRAPADAP
jgi:hypothetical protein